MILSFETKLDFDDQQDVEVHILIKNHGDGWDILGVAAADGTVLELTDDLDAAVTNHVNDNIWEAIEEEKGAEADYRYEQYRDQQMEDANGY